MPRSMTGIRVEGLTKTYRRGLSVEPVRALSDVSLSIAPGEALGIIGPNGAGKTTFLGCLLGFLRPDAGRITIDGHAPDDLAVLLSESSILGKQLYALRNSLVKSQ